MALLRIAPNIEVGSDRVHGCTPWVAQLLVLFLYSRCVTINRRSQQVLVATRWFWFWQSERTIPFNRVSHIIYRAQALPSASPVTSRARAPSSPALTLLTPPITSVRSS